MSEGTVYLVHLERKIGGHAQHYIGWTAGPVEHRIAQHARGRGSRLLEVAAAAHIRFKVVRTWPGTRQLERRLKRRHQLRPLCPKCRWEFLADRRQREIERVFRNA